MQQHPKCQEWIERSQQILAGGPATLSKHPSRYATPIAPSVLVAGEGAYVTCPDGETYIDMVAGLGPVILGHSDPSVNLAVYKQIDQMACSTLTTPLETEVAEMLCDIIPGAEQVRWASNGKDVTEAAIRLARYLTGKRHVIYCGYSGGYSDYLITTDKTGGLLSSLSNWNHQVPWRDFSALDQLLETIHAERGLDDVAAIILEVPPEGCECPREETTEAIRHYQRAAYTYGGLYILDEIVTGLRYAMGGAQAYYGVEADLITMSKALGNGHAVAALLGGKDLMEPFEGGKVFLSTTFGGNPVGLAAAKGTLKELQSSRGQRRLEEYGTLLHTQLGETLRERQMPCTLRGNFARMVIEWEEIPDGATKDELRTLWMQETAKRGVLFGVPIFPMTCYDTVIIQKILYAVDGACQAIQKIQAGTPVAEILEVPVSGSVFERYAVGVRGK